MSNKIDFYKNLAPYLECKDYTVSGETYQVQINKEYDMLVTTPVPKRLGDYYESEAYISHTDAKKSLLDKVYQAVKKIALKKKLKLINSFNLSDKTVLDIGAGTGDFLKVCQNNTWKVQGVEPNLNARKIALEKGIQLQETLEQLSNKKFDIITLWHVLEHVEHLQDYIKTLKSLLKENGRIIVAVPNYKSFDANYYTNYWAAFDVPRHLWHFSKTSIIKLFGNEKMTVATILPMKFDAFYVALLSEKYKHGSAKPLTAFFKGLTSNIKAARSGEYSSLIYIIKHN